MACSFWRSSDQPHPSKALPRSRCSAALLGSLRRSDAGLLLRLALGCRFVLRYHVDGTTATVQRCLLVAAEELTEKSFSHALISKLGMSPDVVHPSSQHLHHSGSRRSGAETRDAEDHSDRHPTLN